MRLFTLLILKNILKEKGQDKALSFVPMYLSSC